MYKAKMEFPEGWGVVTQTKTKTCGRGMDISGNNTILFQSYLFFLSSFNQAFAIVLVSLRNSFYIYIRSLMT